MVKLCNGIPMEKVENVMNRFIGTLLVLVLVLTGTVAMASDCEHNVRCTDTTVCLWCPETNVTTYEWVTHNYEYVDMGKNHQAVCKDCGDEGGSGQHTVYCTDPDYCTVCELSLSDFPVVSMIHKGSVVCLNALEHQWQCSVCDYAHEVGAHYGYCYAPDTCDYCKATGVTIQEDKLRHSYVYVDQGAQHQQQCENCDWVGIYLDHQVYCDSDGTCQKCGATGLQLPAEDMKHQMQWVNLGSTHQRQCKNCDYALEPAEHDVNCTAPDKCSKCGATGLTVAPENMRHSLQWVDLGSTHQRQCTDCDYALEPAAHVVNCTAPQKCTKCGAAGLTVAQEDMRHSLQWVDIGEQHQQQCESCEYVRHQGNHVVFCHEQGVCGQCGAEMTDVTEDMIVHEVLINNLGDQHEMRCEHCDFVKVMDHLVLCEDPTVCIDCEATGLSVSESLIECIGPYSFAPLSAAEHRRTCGTCGRTKDFFHSFSDGACVCGQAYEDRLAGDATGDNVVTMEDALAILEYLIDGREISLGNADVNADGNVDIQDALRILQYAAGWNVVLN